MVARRPPCQTPGMWYKPPRLSVDRDVVRMYVFANNEPPRVAPTPPTCTYDVARISRGGQPLRTNTAPARFAA